jgi:hypothetical protein
MSKHSALENKLTLSLSLFSLSRARSFSLTRKERAEETKVTLIVTHVTTKVTLMPLAHSAQGYTTLAYGQVASLCLIAYVSRSLYKSMPHCTCLSFLVLPHTDRLSSLSLS